MLRQIDTLLGTLSSEEKEVLERKFRTFNRSRKSFIVGIKDRRKRETRNNAWTFLSEYYRIIFHAPIRDQLHSFIPTRTQNDQLDTLLNVKRKRESSLSANDQPVYKKSCTTDEAVASVNITGLCKDDSWVRRFFDDSAGPSSSGTDLEQTGCGEPTQASGEVKSTSLSKAGNVITVPSNSTIHQDPCLLLGLYELFEHKRHLFDKLCTELNV